MNMGCIATLRFREIPGDFGSFKVELALFLQITPPGGGTPVWVYDDPEMDVANP